MRLHHYHPIQYLDKNHNPRKGTEMIRDLFILACNYIDKNHNPRKGTEIPILPLTLLTFFLFR